MHGGDGKKKFTEGEAETAEERPADTESETELNGEPEVLNREMRADGNIMGRLEGEEREEQNQAAALRAAAALPA